MFHLSGHGPALRGNAWAFTEEFLFFLYCWSWGRTLNPAMFASTWYSVTTAKDLSPACSLCCRGCLQWIQGSEDGTILFILNMLLRSPCVACHLPIAHGILTFLVHLGQGLFLSAPCPVNNGIALVFLRPEGKANISALPSLSGRRWEVDTWFCLTPKAIPKLWKRGKYRKDNWLQHSSLIC